MNTQSAIPASHGSTSTVYLLTGATGAIGLAIARQLAALPGTEVVLVCRDSSRGEQAIRAVINATGNSQVRAVQADLGRHADIFRLADQWHGPLHALINNAASAPPSRLETPEGIERQFAVNVLGYYWMIEAFGEILKASAPARIVNVASYWAGGLDLNDPEFKRRRYDNDRAYRQSKQANRMLSSGFAARLKSYRIAVNACHPGDVHSTLSHNLGFGGHQTPDQGADTPVWLATDPVGQEQCGGYFEHRRECDCPFSRDTPAVEALFKLCAGYSV